MKKYLKHKKNRREKYQKAEKSLYIKKSSLKNIILKTFKDRLIELSFEAMGKSGPNPPVACIITKGNEILSFAYSTPGGGEHAEARAISMLKNTYPEKDKSKCTLWVSLEPCCHFGKNPPCCEKIVEAGIRKVNYIFDDPNPLVNGKGIAFLKKNNVKVKKLNDWQNDFYPFLEAFFHKLKYNKPIFYLKTATTIDGFIADSYNQSKWITSKTSRIIAHKLRSKSEAILIGGATFLYDMPRLTPRLKKKKQLEAQKKTRIIEADTFQKKLLNKIFNKKDIYYPHRFIILSSLKGISKEHFAALLEFELTKPEDFLKQNGISETSSMSDISDDVFEKMMDELIDQKEKEPKEIDLTSQALTFLIFYKDEHDAERKWHRIQESTVDFPVEKAIIGEVPENLKSYYLEDLETLVLAGMYAGMSFYFIKKAETNFVQKVIEVMNRFGKISLMIEGGGKTLSAFMSYTKPGDKLYHFAAAKILSGRGINMFSSEEKREIEDSFQMKRTMQVISDDDLILTYTRQ